VEEIAGIAASTNADLVLFDHDLSPTQLRNLEAALPCRVLDRTQLILDIFARHARTREGQLQVELAQLEYMLPRLTGRGKAMSQLGGGIGTRGPGETSSKPTAAASSGASISSSAISKPCAACAASSASAARPFPCPRSPWSATPTPAKARSSIPHRRAGARVGAHVCHARSQAARHRAAQPPPRSAV
jgi:hypothetical protein